MERRNYLGVITTLLFAGCLSSSDEPSSGPSETASDTSAEWCPTDTQNQPDIIVYNRANRSQTVTVTLTKNPDEDEEETVYERTFELAPDARVSEDEAVFTETGEHRLTAELDDGTTESRNRTITAENREAIRQWGSYSVEIQGDGTLTLSGGHAEPDFQGTPTDC